MNRTPPPHQSQTIPEEHLEFIERLLFYELDEAIKKQADGYPNYDEVVAYENALETMTTIRRLLSDRNDVELIEETAEHVLDTLNQPDNHSNQSERE